MKIIALQNKDEWWKEFSSNLYRFLQWKTTFDNVKHYYYSGYNGKEACGKYIYSSIW